MMGKLRRSSSNGAQGQGLRTLRNGLAATVPHSLLAYDLNISRGNRRYTRRQSTLQQHAENMELRCCRINVLLVTMQTFLGITITALGFYMRTLTTSLELYETPFWAGFPLSFTGSIGMYLCATDFRSHQNKMMLIVKVLCFILSAFCFVVCLVASIPAGIHGQNIAGYEDCLPTNHSPITNLSLCTCNTYFRGEEILIFYDNVRRCNLIFSSIKDYLILECALNSVAGGVSLWFVLILYQSQRRQRKYSGLRFNAANANVCNVVSSSPVTSILNMGQHGIVGPAGAPQASNVRRPSAALEKRLLKECRIKERS